MYDTITALFSPPPTSRSRSESGHGRSGPAGRRLDGARLGAILEHAFDGIWVLAADGSIRQATAGFTGRPADSLEGRPAEALIHPDDSAAWAALFAEVSATPAGQRTATLRVAAPADGWQRGEARLRNLLGHPEVAGVVVDWRALDDAANGADRTAARQTAELAAVNRELEAFSYSVSHDLRAPLRRLDGFARILLEDCQAGLDDRGRYCVECIHDSARSMNDLIDGLLDLAGVTRVAMTRERVDLSALAAAIVGELRERAPERVVDVRIAADMSADGDPRLFFILLQTLLANACTYTGPRPAAHTGVGVMRGDGPPVYFVRDDGAGFDMRQAQRLFGAFQRLHAADEFDGTGIGLATVQRIVHRHGGRVWGEGAVDHGATFRFTLGA